MEIIHTIWLGAAFLAVFLIAEILHQRAGIQAEYSRKITHFSSGFLILLFPLLINSLLWVGILCSGFMALLWVSKKYKFFKGIHGVDRKTDGSFLYPIAVYGTYVFWHYYPNYIHFYIPILTLAVCDPLAALVGKATRWLPYRIAGNTKSVSGSLAFAAGSVLLSSSILFINKIEFTDFRMVQMGWIAVSCTMAEALFQRGYDNIAIPAAAILVFVATENIA